MSEKTRKQDRRTRYTRQTIKDTFLELLKQKSFTKITVTEICKNAEINRGTFYLHYYDIHDVLSDIFNMIYNKNSPTSSGSEMNCRFEHKCS